MSASVPWRGSIGIWSAAILSKPMSSPPIPDEQLKRIQPSVDDLLTQLRALIDRMPPNTESALVFELDAEERE